MQNPIKLEEAVKRLSGGEVGAIAEYRFSKAEVMKWRDKESGKPLSAPILRHTVETAGQTIAITERVADDFDVLNYKPQFVKGQKVLVTITELTTVRGNTSGRGSLTPIA